MRVFHKEVGGQVDWSLPRNPGETDFFCERGWLRVLSATLILSKSSRVLDAKSRLESANLS